MFIGVWDSNQFNAMLFTINALPHVIKLLLT